jgi:transmembrane sensor
MSEPSWAELGKKIDPRWGSEREQSARTGIERRATKRRSARRVAASVAALALVAGAAGAFVRMRTQAPSIAAAVPSASATVGHEVATFSVTRFSSETELEPLPDSNRRGFVLRAGGARFTVQHDAEHPFVVVAGDLSIEDLGTTFTVQYLADHKLEVAVEEGRVKVSARGVDTDTEIAAGDRRQFPLAGAVETPTFVPAPPGTSPWRPLAESGRYEEAHTALRKAGPNAVRDETADLLLAADTARLGGYPSEAVPYLERVVRAHSSDPRSSLASFTLGRVLLDELGRPREAADAFARARAAGGPLAEDALAREVEAASRAGDTIRSRELAREYQTKYPKGRRAKAVARFGGLD